MKHIIKYSGFIRESLDDESQGEESQSEEKFWEDVYHLPDDEFSGSAIPDIEINKFGTRGTSLHELLERSLMDAGISDELIRAKAK